MEKLVSVIMPVRNGGRFIGKAIDSILNQTYKNTEIIVVEEGSDDGSTVDILESYGNKIKCFFLTEHNGVAGALNFGLEHASGEYIARMDADDIAMPDRLLKQVTFLKTHSDIGVLGTECDIIDENDKIVDKLTPGYYSDSQIKAKLMFENSIIHPTVMIRRSLIDQGWRYDISYYAEDLNLWTRMASEGVQFANLPERLLYYRRCGGEASSATCKVAPSAAKSAQNYVEAMFGITHEKYKIHHFTRPYYRFLVQTSYTEFVRGQLLLLNEIYEKNEECKKISQADLIRELNARWNWVIREYCYILTVFGDFQYDLISVPDMAEEFFLFYLKKRLNVDTVDEILTVIELMLNVGEKQANAVLKQNKSVVIYGMGKRGIRVLESFFEKKRKGSISWELLAVADKKESSFMCCNRKFTSISKEELEELKPDFVLISSEKYFDEIKGELVQKGMELSRLLHCDWLL